MSRKIRKFLTVNKMDHLKVYVNRNNVPQLEGERRMINLEIYFK